MQLFLPENFPEIKTLCSGYQKGLTVSSNYDFIKAGNVKTLAQVAGQ
jgi:hypothetical protein